MPPTVLAPTLSLLRVLSAYPIRFLATLGTSYMKVVQKLAREYMQTMSSASPEIAAGQLGWRVGDAGQQGTMVSFL